MDTCPKSRLSGLRRGNALERSHIAIRLTDAFAALMWLAFLAFLGLAQFVSWHDYLPWCVAAACLAATQTNIAYLSRHFALVESEAFARGFRAGQVGTGGVTDIRKRV